MDAQKIATKQHNHPYLLFTLPAKHVHFVEASYESALVSGEYIIFYIQEEHLKAKDSYQFWILE